MPELLSSKKLKSVMKAYFGRLEKSRHVAWCTSVGPAELLRAAGFEVYFPENHGALLGATRTAGDCIANAVAAGYSGDICSYLTSDVGAFIRKTSPLVTHYGLKGIPKPDLIVYCTNQCREVQDWFTYYGEYYNCPVAGIFPPRHVEEVTASEIDDVAAQFMAMVPLCEKVTGKKFDADHFRDTVRLSREASELWNKILMVPARNAGAFSFFDAVIHMGPMVVMRGTTEAVDYYRSLLEELNALPCKEGAGRLPRLYWEGMPIWGKLRSLSDLFEQNGASVVASTYCNSWIFDSFDERDPFRSTAKAYTEIFINRSEHAKTGLLKKIAGMFNIDGFIFHDAKTCFNNSNTRFGMPSRLTRETGMPSLVIEGDLCDLRFYSEGQTVTKIETFIEQLRTSGKTMMQQ